MRLGVLKGDRMTSYGMVEAKMQTEVGVQQRISGSIRQQVSITYMYMQHLPMEI